jgi:hypothetical protein
MNTFYKLGVSSTSSLKPVTVAHKRIASECSDNPPALRQKGQGLHDNLLGPSAAAR